MKTKQFLDKLPRHIAIIMDGNGRWAKERGLARMAGHRAGVKTVGEIVKSAVEIGIPILTLYAFSQENWKRPKEEVNVLMGLLDSFLNKEVENLAKQGIQLRILGKIEALTSAIQAKINKAVHRTAVNSKLILNIALNYGSRTEILDAVAEIIKEGRENGWSNGSSMLTEEYFSEHLYTAGLPDPDLLIRTSGEMRLSNFLLWQLSYAEIYITKKYWPDFKKADLEKAIDEYRKRERRFGDVEGQQVGG